MAQHSKVYHSGPVSEVLEFLENATAAADGKLLVGGGFESEAEDAQSPLSQAPGGALNELRQFVNHLGAAAAGKLMVDAPISGDDNDDKSWVVLPPPPRSRGTTEEEECDVLGSYRGKVYHSGPVSEVLEFLENATAAVDGKLMVGGGFESDAEEEEAQAMAVEDKKVYHGGALNELRQFVNHLGVVAAGKLMVDEPFE
jgi:predicted alpha/beta hydrolase family esterase